MTTTTTALATTTNAQPFVAAESTGFIAVGPLGTSHGKSVSRQLIREALRVFIAEQPDRATRAVDLLAELGDIAADRAIADRLPEPGAWQAELLAEERDVWDRLSEVLSS